MKKNRGFREYDAIRSQANWKMNVGVYLLGKLKIGVGVRS